MRLWFVNRDNNGAPDSSVELKLYNATGSGGSWSWGSEVGSFTNMGDGNYYIEVTSSGNYGIKKSTDGGSSWTALTKTLGMFLGTEDITVHISDSTIHFTEGSIDHKNIMNIGTYTHSEIDTHIDDDDKHREINDSGTSTTDLWSANKINSELNNKFDTGDDPYIYGYDAGQVTLTKATAEATTSTGDTELSIAVNVPENARVIGCQLRVDAALSQDFKAEYSGGLTQQIGGSISKDKNTKVNKWYDVNTDSDITSGVTNIKITPSLGSFSGGGTVRAIVYYYKFTDMASVGT